MKRLASPISEARGAWPCDSNCWAVARIGDLSLTLPTTLNATQTPVDVLVIDDNVDYAENLAEILSGVDATVRVVHSVAEARTLLAARTPDILFVDLRLPDEPGEKLVLEVAEHSPESLSIVLTGNATIQSAISSVNAGAFGFLLKDMPVEAILSAYTRAVERIALVQQKRELELQLSHSEQLAVIGQMAATLAHEIKNPLTGISHALQVLLDAVGEPPDMQGLKESILKRFGQLNHLVEDLLEFSKPMTVKRALIDLKGLVAETVEVHPEVPIQISVADDACHAWVDGNHIRMLLRNLTENAVIAAASVDAPVVTLEVRRDGDDLVMEVADNGEGIPPESLSEVFRPFFTTRTRGTGLGLSLAARIVEAHGGRLAAANRIDRGARFSTWIPSAFKES